MAQLEPKSDSGRTRKKSTYVDMTAMVDIAFLLLTFFILTTTMIHEKKAIKLLTPVEDTGPEKIVDNKILTLVTGADRKVHYFFGLSDAAAYTTNLGPDGLREVLLDHRDRYPNRCKGKQVAGCWDPIVVLKPGPASNYGDLVDVLDELALAGMTKYSFGRLLPADSLLLADHRLK